MSDNSCSTTGGPARVGIWIPITDAARARAFYTAVLGWTCMPKAMPSPIDGIMETYFFTKGGTLNGCFCTMDDESKIARAAEDTDRHRIGVLAVFEVDNVEAALERVAGNGGREHVGRTSMGPGMGFVARFIDSEGNLLGLYSPK